MGALANLTHGGDQGTQVSSASLTITSLHWAVDAYYIYIYICVCVNEHYSV